MTFRFAPRCRWWVPLEPAHNNGPAPLIDPDCPAWVPGATREDQHR